jgi:hypothetical protein
MQQARSYLKSAGLVARDLNRRGIPSPAMILAARRGKPVRRIAWSQRTIGAMIHNPYYRGEAAFDRTMRVRPERPTKRYRLKEKSSDRARSQEDWVTVAVPAIVTEAEQATPPRRRWYRAASTAPGTPRGSTSCAACSGARTAASAWPAAANTQGRRGSGATTAA